MFDPLGLITPVLIKGKILFQDATCLGLSRDEPVPSHLMIAWHKWMQSFDDLNEVQMNLTIHILNFIISVTQMREHMAAVATFIALVKMEKSTLLFCKQSSSSQDCVCTEIGVTSCHVGCAYGFNASWTIAF